VDFRPKGGAFSTWDSGEENDFCLTRE